MAKSYDHRNQSEMPNPGAYLRFLSFLKSFLLLFIFLGVFLKFLLEDQKIVNAYLEDYDSLFFAILSFSPVLLILFIRIEKLRLTRSWIIPTLATFGVIVSYISNLELRAIFSKLYGIYLMPLGLGDWVFIPNFIRCEESSGCDPLNRIAGYGLSWKVFYPLSNEFLSVLILAVAVFYIVYEVGRFAFFLELPLLQVMLFLSPSFLFALERGNADLFLFALILFGIRFIKKLPAIDIVYAVFLTTLKPFFVGYIFKRMPKKRVLIFSIPLLGFAYFWSMNLDANLIKSMRMSTIYPPQNQIGADQIPSIFLQQFISIVNKTNATWSGSLEMFYPSLVLGILLLLFVVLILLRNFPTKSVVEQINQLPEKFRQLTWVTMGIFLIVFLSGSQVSYKSWMAYPLLFLCISILRTSIILKDRISICVVVFLTFGCLGINLWTLRNIGTLALAGLCLACMIQFYFPNFCNNVHRLGRNNK
jgi:hypothetical protein